MSQSRYDASGSVRQNITDAQKDTNNSIYNSVGDHIRAHETILQEKMPFSDMTWEQGTFGADGSNTTATSILRMTSFVSIPASKFAVNIANGYSYAYVELDSNGIPVSGTGATWYTNSGIITTTGKTIRFKVKLTAGGTATAFFKNAINFNLGLVSPSPLNGKILAVIGDSLINGNQLGNLATWIAKLANKHGMNWFNYGINGNTVAYQTIETTNLPMSRRYSSMNSSADYVVFLGGANDKRLNVPIGTNDDGDDTTFKGALKVLISGLLSMYPKARLLGMTNYNRYPSLNTLNLSDIDYVNAMIEICALYGIPCFDNYHNLGISFQNSAQLSWIDEGLSLSQTSNCHFSDEGYDWLVNKYEKVLENL